MAHIHRNRGFTLLEMMLVLFLTGLTVSVVIFVWPNNQQHSVKKSSQRLNHTLQWLAERTVLQGEFYGIQVTPSHWQIMRLAENPNGNAAHWTPVAWRHLKTEDTLPQGFTLNLQLDETIETAATDVPQPQIWLLPGGEVTPASLTFLNPDNQPFAQVTLDDNGDIHWQELPLPENSHEK